MGLSILESGAKDVLIGLCAKELECNPLGNVGGNVGRHLRMKWVEKPHIPHHCTNDHMPPNFLPDVEV